jgi:peptidoglycan/LPS O-acetylase OafA/YrhL
LDGFKVFSPTIKPIRERLLYLDGWRGASIALVLIGHFFPVPGINLGLFGVELFFVLSGRLMAEILFIEQYPLQKFFKRRLFRIYPALLVFVVLCMVILNGSYMSVRWTTALSVLTFSYNYLALFIKKIQTVDHIWSLCIEEHAYIVLAIVAYLAAQGRVRVVMALSLITALSIIDGVVSFLWTGDYELSYWRTDAHIASISISALICVLKHQGRLHQLFHHKWTALIALGVAVVFALQAVPMYLHYVVATPLLALAVNSIDDLAEPVRKMFSSRLLSQFGLWSFSIYLYQQPFFKLVNDGKAQAIHLIGPAIVCGIASYYLVEKPARAALNARFARQSTARPAGENFDEASPGIARA